MGELFFEKEEVAKQHQPQKPKRAPKASKLDCETCGLYKEALYSPKMDVHGQGEAGVLVLGEAPGPEEDEQDDQWVGEVGKLLRKWLRRMDLDLERDCWRLNAANCFPGRDKKGEIKAPTNKQVACCKVVKVQPVIDELKPKFILLLGNSALQSFYAGRQSNLNITKFRGRAFPDAQTGAWVLPLFHPSFLNRNKSDTMEALWERDLIRAVNRIDRDRPPVIADPTEHLEVLTDFDEVIEWLEYARKYAPWLVFDYECTGLKPYAPGHKLISIAFATRWQGDDHVSGYSFALQHPDIDPAQQLEILGKWVELMIDPSLPKVAHNFKHEDMWTREIVGVPVEGWSWCTMNNAHIADNTRGITGLKFQAFWQYGVEGYDDASKRYITGVLTEEERDTGANVSTHHHNRMLDMPLEELLLYGGCDAVLTGMLYEKQTKQIRVGEPLFEAMNLIHNAATMFCDLQAQGVPVDEEYYQTKRVELEEEEAALTQELMRSKEAKLFYVKEGRPIKLTSNTDLPKLLFTYMGEASTKTTKGGNASVDAEALTDLDLPFTNKLIHTRKLQKIVEYMDQISREAVNGRVYPTTNFNIPVTYRPSMDGPNFANTPKREPMAKELVRHGIMAEPGCKMMEVDFVGIEVCGAGWYSQDKVLLDYLHSDGDLHRDQAQIIFDITPKEWGQFDPKAVSMLRFFAKNGWVFPQIYGSYYVNCAAYIWKNCINLPVGAEKGLTVRKWLGMSYTRFEERLRRHEDVFWDQFYGVRKWQDSVSEEYIAKGYIETFMGFRFGGWMTRNNLYNYKIQGTAFHVLLWCMIQLHKMSKERKWTSRLMWQIYDSMVWSLYPPEQEKVVAACKHVMCVEAPKQFPWINTPLLAEFEITKVGGRFADLKGIDETDNYEEEA